MKPNAYSECRSVIYNELDKLQRRPHFETSVGLLIQYVNKLIF